MQIANYKLLSENLESEINAFLSENSTIELKDIKFWFANASIAFAMVIYKQN